MSWQTVKCGCLKVWHYFAPSWEGPDGKFSYRRATQFVWVWCMVYMIVTARQSGGSTQYEFYQFLTVAILFTLTVGLLSFEQLFRLAKLTAPLKLMEAENDPPGRTEENPPDPEISGADAEIIKPKTESSL